MTAVVAEYPRRQRDLNPLPIGHRGLLDLAPENTMPGFELAVRRGIPIVEFDVRLTKDGVPVVIHDDTVDRTTDGHGRVRDYSFEDLRRLDAGRWFSLEFAGARVPRLEEVLECIGNKAWCLIELKEDDVVAATAQRVARYGLQQTTMFQSFSVRALELARMKCPEVHRVLLTYSVPDPAVFLQGPAQALSLHSSRISDPALRQVMSLGIPLHLWPVDDEQLLARCLELRPDCIASNRTDLLEYVMKLD